MARAKKNSQTASECRAAHHWTQNNGGASSGSRCRWAREERQNQCKKRHLPRSQWDLIIRVLHMVLQCQSSNESAERFASDAAFTSPPAKRKRNDLLWKSRHRSVKNTNPIHSRRGHPETDEDTWPTCAQSTRMQKTPRSTATMRVRTCRWVDRSLHGTRVRNVVMKMSTFIHKCSRW